MRILLAALTALSLAGCAEPVSGPTAAAASAASDVPSSKRVLPDYAYETSFNYAMASTIVKTCPQLELRILERRRMLEPLIRRLKSDGYSEPFILQAIQNVSRERLLQDTTAYTRKRGIVPDNAESFCAAGRLEIAEGTEIGRYLRG